MTRRRLWSVSWLLVLSAILVGCQGDEFDRDGSAESLRAGHDLFEDNEMVRKKVLIVGEYRGGATFVSEFFNQNLNATFDFEPLYLTRRMPDKDEREEMKMKILRDYFEDCRYPKTDEYLPKISHLGNWG